MERKEYLKFSSELWDGFEVLSKHTNNEIQFVKDIIKFFKKRAEIEEEYAKNLSRLAQKAQYTSPHGTIRTAWEAVLTEVQNTSGIHTSVVGHLNERVIDTLNNFMRDMESQRKQLVTEGTNLNNEYASTVDHLKKTKSNYEKSCKEAEIAQVTAEKSKTDPLTKPKEREKLEKEAQKKKTTADQLDDDYRKKVDDTNNFMEKYFTEKMPKILGDFEHMETARIQSLKVNLRKYVKLLQEVPPSLTKESEGLSNYVERIHADNDIDQFVNQNKTHQEIPEPFDYEPYQGGNQQARTKPTQKIKRFIIKKAQQVTAVKDAQGGTPASPVMGTSPAATNSPFMPSSPVQRPKTAIFGVTPEEVMEKQRAKFPEDTIPHLLPVLVDAVFRMQGTKTEGIFRIPAGGAELNTVKDRLDHGNYDVITGCTQVYTPCALIKLWLRELPEGLVPSSFYDVCADTPDKGLEVIEQIPALNKQVLVYLINFIQELTKPETVEATKMSTDNLAMVFGPGILRCPYSDYNRVLAAADKQKAFLMYLIQNIPRSETPVWSEAPAALNKSESIAVEEEQQVEEKEKEMDEVPL